MKRSSSPRLCCRLSQVFVLIFFAYLLIEQSKNKPPNNVPVIAATHSVTSTTASSLSLPSPSSSLQLSGGIGGNSGDWNDRQNCVSLVDRAGEVFLYHWLVLNLGSLCRHYKPGLVVDVYTYPWLTETAASTYHRESMKFFEPHFHFPYPNQPEPADGHCPNEWGAILWQADRPDPESHFCLRGLTSLALSEYPGGTPEFQVNEMVYITREGRPQRSILNEASFLAEFQKMGIRRVKLEDLSFAEKIKLFATARLIISPQSASLTFTYATDRRALIIEIFQETERMLHYRHLARDLHLQWRRFSDVEVVGELEPIFTSNFNFIVNGPALIEFVQKGIAETQERAEGRPIKDNNTEAIDGRFAIYGHESAAELEVSRDDLLVRLNRSLGAP
jgi:hypothetical protein